MFFTDTSDPNADPFVSKCYEMTLKRLKIYQAKLVRKFNDLYETSNPGNWEEAEEAEEYANIAGEVLHIRLSREIT